MKIKLVAINGRYSHSCLALFYVREELRRHLPQTEIELHQFTINDPYYDTLIRITAGSPGAVFFSVYIWNSDFVLRLARDLAVALPETALVFGGPQSLILRDELPFKATILQGEIEGAPAAFYEDLKGKSLGRDYQATRSEGFPSPFREDDFTSHLKNRYIYYESSRGCPFSCSYCLSSVEHGVRHKGVAQVREELAVILKYQPKIIKFVDRTFNDNPERALAIWHFLAEQEGETLFHFEIAPDRFTEEIFAFLATVAPGRFQFEIGVQSTNPETLAAVNRRIKLEKIHANISRLVAMDNIHLHVDLILGLPHEDEVSFKKSFNDVFRIRPHYLQMGLLKVLPGTAIGQEPDFGLRYSLTPPYSILANRWLDHDQLTHLYLFGECIEAFYNNRFFKTFLEYVLEVEADPAAFFEGLLAICRTHDFFDRSATQDLMCRMLFELAKQRSDRELVLDLLRYDWLRCGHRFLPEYLGNTSNTDLRNRLFRTLPQNLLPFFDYRGRDEFFKRAFFYEFSGELIERVGLGGVNGSGCVAFLPEQTAGVMKWSRAILLTQPETNQDSRLR